jgi:hypothetical protein
MAIGTTFQPNRSHTLFTGTLTVLGHRFTLRSRGAGGPPTAQELDDLRASFEQAQKYLSTLSQGITLPSGNTPETPLQIELIDKSLISRSTAGFYNPEANILYVYRGANFFLDSHELNHAISDFETYEDTNRDTRFAADNPNHPIHSHPMRQACQVDSPKRIPELETIAMSRTLTDPERTEKQRLQQEVRRRGAISSHFCYSKYELVAELSYFTGNGKLDDVFAIAEERLKAPNYNFDRRQDVVEELIHLYVESGDSEINKRAAKLLEEYCFRFPQEAFQLRNGNLTIIRNILRASRPTFMADLKVL